MAKTKVLSVVANPNERVGPNFGLTAAVENAVDAFLKENKGESLGFSLAGTVIDGAAGNAADSQAVFGRTLVVLTWEPVTKASKKK